MNWLEKNRRIAVIVGLLGAGSVGIGLSSLQNSEPTSEASESETTGRKKSTPKKAEEVSASWPTARYVGNESCADCHQKEMQAYRGSDHDRAISVPTPESVLAPFAGEAHQHDGITTRFSRDGEDYVVSTVGADAQRTDFKVAYTFGHFPLQQYLLDTGGGRLQSFTIAWDSRPKEEGGQRYYDLYPDEILEPGDQVHWASPAQSWNFACADCHTTGLQKGYDPQKDEYSLSYGQLNVGCEACHGPASNHLTWAEKGEEARQLSSLALGFENELSRVKWERPNSARSALPRAGKQHVAELETCAPCHSRRQQLREGKTPEQPFLDSYVPELLTQGLYYADGQIRDEVYVYGSFTQSRMFQVGVRCNDCHEPHSLALRKEGNELCSSCHDAKVFDTLEHHHHEAEGSACVDCHMPQTTYMGVDARRDHSLRIPRPELSAKVGAPDACTSCHEEKSQTWAATTIDSWFPGKKAEHYGDVFHAAQRGEPGVVIKLMALANNTGQPAIVRGTALMLLGSYPSAAVLVALTKARASDQVLIRLGVARAAVGLPPRERLSLLLPLLKDPFLGIRTEAARAAAGAPTAGQSAAARAEIEKALAELEETELFYADRADAWLRIAMMRLGEGKPEQAVTAMEKSLKIDPHFIPSLINLADLKRSQGRELEAAALLKKATEIDELSAEAWFGLGLSFVRQKKLAESLPLLKRATEIRTDSARYFNVYGVALAESGNLPAALVAFQEGLSHHPYDRSLLQSLVGFARQAGDATLATDAMTRLTSLGPPPPR